MRSESWYERIKRKTYESIEILTDDPKFWPLIHAFFFTIVDTSLYLLSEDNFFMHIGKSSAPVSDLESESDKFYLGLILAGNTCTFIATLGSYFVRIKNNSLGEKGKTFQGLWGVFLSPMAVLSILNKSLATSSSAYALTRDYTQEPGYLWSVFGGSLLSNLLVQTAVQMEITTWHGDLSKRLALPISVLGTTFYNVSLLMLSWNTFNSAFIDCKFIKPEERVSFNKIFATPLSKSMALVSGPLFLCAAVANEVKFIPYVVDRLTPKKSDEGSESDNDPETFSYAVSKTQIQIKHVPSLLNNILTCLHRVSAVGNSLLRTLLMFLAFAALIFKRCEDDTMGYMLGFGLSLLCLKGNWTANYSLLSTAKEATVLPSEEKSKESIELRIKTDKTRLLPKPRSSQAPKLLCCSPSQDDNYVQLN